MTMNPRPPHEVLQSAKLIRDLKNKNFLSREEKTALNRAKLHIAYWACRSENIIASRENLTYVLGGDAVEIMAVFDKYLQYEKTLQGKGPLRDIDTSMHDSFWDNI